MKKVILSLLVVISTVGIMPLGVSAKWKEDVNKNRFWIENGLPAKGWKQISGKMYNFRDDGVMRTGWMMYNGDWYYLWSDGTMAYNTWMTNGGYWYYFDQNGKMVSDAVIIENKKYDFNTKTFIFSEDLTSNKELSNTDSQYKK